VKKLLESHLRRQLREDKRFADGTVTLLEPGKGSDTGLPDSFFAVNGHWEPIELKRGHSVISELRPSQKRWHRNSLYHGIQTYGLLLRRDESVLMVALALSGGLMSELLEHPLAEFKLYEFNHGDVVNAISSYISRT
jgi:hypothetical protein